MAVNLSIDYSNLLTPDVLAEMPANLSQLSQFNWRKDKENELIALGFTGHAEHDAALRAQLFPKDNPISDDTENTENGQSEDDTETNINTSGDTDIQSEESDTCDFDADVIPVIDIASKSGLKKAEPKRVINKSVTNKSISNDYEDIRTVPRSVLLTIRRMLPGTASKADLISAFVYIFTNGDCKISDNAMRMVEAYREQNKEFNVNESINEQLSALRSMVRRQSDMLQSIELCTCYNAFDRRYGSAERRLTPRETEFREKGNLDMLHRLRIQASDQRKVDDIERGRQIYEQTKGKND